MSLKKFTASKALLLTMLLMGGICASAQNMKPFTVEGPEDRYNMIRVVNETSLDSLNCRIVIVNDLSEVKELYGVYNLKGKFDKDSKTKWVTRGTDMALEMPKDCPIEVSIAVEYVDRPIWDFIIIHITDAGKY